MRKNTSLIWTMAFLIVGTSIGAGILGLPLETGLAGFWPSLFSLLLVWALMTTTGWIFVYKLNNSKQVIDDFATLYEIELGNWAKLINSFGYFLTFYGLIVAYLSGASSTVVEIIPALHSIPFANNILTVIFFIAATSIVLFGMDIIRKGNAILTTLLFVFFALLILLIAGRFDSANLAYAKWNRVPLVLPILATAFGFHVVIPIINTHAKKYNINIRNILKILLLGTTIVMIINLLWITIVMGVLPLTATNGISITDAIKKGVPATVPIAKLVKSNLLLIFALLFTFLAITTSYLGVCAGFMNYIKGLTAPYFKRNKFTDTIIVFLIPLIITLTYPDLFITMLNIVGGIGVIAIFGILPGIMAAKRNNPNYIRILGFITLILSFFIFITECIIIITT
jgi:tyrosine-specific transport protein